MEVVFDGSPNWTEQGANGGLDPLAMLAPIERLYTDLLQGVSSVTDRIRYYSFYCWWVTQFPNRSLDQTQSAFRQHIRDGEVLLGLASLYDHKERGWLNGVGGATAISEALDAQGEIDLRSLADGYLLTPVYYAAYRSQITAMGLMVKAVKHSERVPTELGKALGGAFLEQVGSLPAKLFFECAERGTVTKDKLAALVAFRCEYLDPQADDPEITLLRRVLTGRDGTGSRRNTCIKILRTVKTEKRDLSDYDLRFIWLETEPDSLELTYKEHVQWRHYQLADATRIGLEALLHHATAVLVENEGGMSPVQLASAIVVEVPYERDFEIYLLELADTQDDCRTLQEAAIEGMAELTPIMRLIAYLWFNYRHLMGEMAEVFPRRGHFHTTHTEFEFLETLLELPAREAVASLVLQRVIRRHMDVASRKLRTQGNFTFQFEYEEGTLAPRQTGRVGPSSPRTGTMISFLNEVGLLSKSGVTELGEQELLTNT
jgi:hypothetical protein